MLKFFKLLHLFFLSVYVSLIAQLHIAFGIDGYDSDMSAHRSCGIDPAGNDILGGKEQRLTVTIKDCQRIILRLLLERRVAYEIYVRYVIQVDPDTVICNILPLVSERYRYKFRPESEQSQKDQYDK